MTRVVVPYVRIEEATIYALDCAGVHWQSAQMTADDSYYRLLEALWVGPDGFVVVEQRIVIGPTTIAEMEACPHDWCAATYPYANQDDYAGLGCVKFSADLLARYPTMMDDIGTWKTASHPTPKFFCPLDQYIQAYLKRAGEEQHKHGPVRHLGDRWPTHGCLKAG